MIGGTHMIRKSILSVLGGVVFAAVLSFPVSAGANCFGFCAGQIGRYYFAGCEIDWIPGRIDVTCYYTEGPDPSGDPSITD